MAGDSAQEKTEQPTPHKLQKAREKGQVAQSRELTGGVVLAVAIGVLAYQGSALGGQLETVTRKCIAAATETDLSMSVLLSTTFESVNTMLLALAPLFVVIVIFGLALPFVQIGALLAGDPLKPKLERLDPIKGFKNLFFSVEAYFNLFKAVAKIAVLGIICGMIIVESLRRVVLLSTQEPMMVVATAEDIIMTMVKRALLFFLALGVIDLFYQRWKFIKDQKMSKQEVEKEFKEQEGDPTHKAERKRLHEEIATNAMLQGVRDADVVLVNPTHIACALRFNPDDEDAPRLIGKGRGYLAERIKEIAKEEGIPIMRDVSLARTLYEMELDTQIPEELYEVVAEVLRWVEETARSKGQLPQWVKTRDEDGD